MKDLSNEELINKFRAMCNLFIIYGKFQKDPDFNEANKISDKLLSHLAAGEEAVKKVAELEKEVSNLQWWREHGQKLRNAVAENFTYARSDNELINAPKEARLKIIELEKEVERLKKRELDYYKFSQKQGVIIDRLKVDNASLLTREERIKG